MKKWFLLCSALLSFSLFADAVNFISKPMSAGKASLAENAYSISRLLDTANFSPEFKWLLNGIKWCHSIYLKVLNGAILYISMTGNLLHINYSLWVFLLDKLDY